MVRTTRVSQVVTEEPTEAPSSPARKGTKKRKRTDASDAKSIKDNRKKTKSEHEGSVESEAPPDKMDFEPEDADAMDEDEPEASGPSLSSFDAQRVLEVLQAVDPANVLDEQATFKGNTTSLRKLLQDPASISLRALRDRVRHVTPIVAPRRVAKQPARLKFFNLAREILDDVAERSAQPNLEPEPIDDEEQDAVKEEERDLSLRPESSFIPTKYALYQHLPTGDYFTSAANLSYTQVNSLVKGQASILAVVPSVLLPPSSLPKLGDYATGTSTHAKKPITFRKGPIQISSAAFLDYGVFSSFAPSFDSDGGQVGRETLGFVSSMKKEHLRKKLLASTSSIPKQNTSPQPPCIDPALDPFSFDDSKLLQDHKSLMELARQFLSEDEARALISGLDDLELDNGISELLVKNGRALRALLELQERRFRAGSTEKEVPVEVDGEEWQLARQLLSSLTTLVSLRPRASSSTTKPDSVIPSSSFLHTLHRTLPRDAMPGWRGTLSSTRDFALIDNATLRANSSTLPVPPPAVPQQQQLPPPPGTAPLPPAAARPPATYAYSARPNTYVTPAATPAPRPGAAPPASYYSQGYAPQPYYGQQTQYPHTQGYYSGYAGYGQTYGTPAAAGTYSPALPAGAVQSPGAQGRAIPNLAAKSAIPPATWGGAIPSSPLVGTGGVAIKPGNGAMPNATSANTPAPALPPHLRRVNGVGGSAPTTPGGWGHPSTPTPASRATKTGGR